MGMDRSVVWSDPWDSGLNREVLGFGGWPGWYNQRSTIFKDAFLSREPPRHGAHRETDVWQSDDRTAGGRGLRRRAGRGHHVAPRQIGLITLDPGFSNTGVSQSSISYVDGEKGVLRYRGIPIEQLAGRSNFVETSFLLIYGHLPSKDELDRFGARVTANAALHESFKHHFEGFPVDAPPMAMLSAMVNTLACFYRGPSNRGGTSSTRRRRGC